MKLKGEQIMLSVTPDVSVNNQKKENSDSERALLALLVAMALGFLGIILYALQSPNSAKFVSFAAIGIMVAGASVLIGSLLGFLFGIPRTLQQDAPVEIARNNAADSAEDDERPANYRANTNLEQISDWLTKILVGVGLTQITVIPGKLHEISNAVASGLDNTDGNRVFAIAVILFFAICGFLFGYLWTRLFLPGAFRQADLSALVNRVEKANQEVKQVNRKLDELEKQSELDAKALSLFHRQINPSADVPAVTQEELNETFKAATISVREQIYNQAYPVRADNWLNDKAKMELTIPVFRALAECDGNKIHGIHGQLGFALKDQTNPDWAQAEAELTKAISLRGLGKENGWLFYEFNRAYCRIMGDEEFKQEQPSKPEAKDKILLDLRAAAASDDLKEIIRSEPNIKKWMSLNKLNMRNLG
jgi:hypothetical protein